MVTPVTSGPLNDTPPHEKLPCGVPKALPVADEGLGYSSQHVGTKLREELHLRRGP